VERGIETGELRGARKEPLGFTYELKSNGNVQRRKKCGRFKFRKQLRRDFLVFDELWAAVDYAVADGGGSGEFAGVELIGDQPKSVRLRVDGMSLVVQRFAICGFQRDFPAIGGDAVGGAGGDGADIILAGLEEAEFQGGGAAVDDEDGADGDGRLLEEKISPKVSMLMLSRM